MYKKVVEGMVEWDYDKEQYDIFATDDGLNGSVVEALRISEGKRVRITIEELPDEAVE